MHFLGCVQQGANQWCLDALFAWSKRHVFQGFGLVKSRAAPLDPAEPIHLDAPPVFCQDAIPERTGGQCAACLGNSDGVLDKHMEVHLVDDGPVE